jgi:hypothetical protein
VERLTDASPVRLPSSPNTAVMELDASSETSACLPLLYARASQVVPWSAVGCRASYRTRTFPCSSVSVSESAVAEKPATCSSAAK